jgi:hypothetical protein
MFLNELSSIVTDFVRQPIAFGSGFIAGALGLNLNDDPIRSWLNREFDQGLSSGANLEPRNGQTDKPRTISID